MLARGNAPSVTPSDDALGRRVRAGDLVARDELVQRHRPLALYIANSYQRRCRCRENDLPQAALLGLIRGANAFDPDRHPGKTFAAIARYYVKLEILDYLYGRSLIRIPHSARPTEIAKRPIGAVRMNTKWTEHRAWIEHCAARAAKVVQGHDVELDHPDPSQFCPGLEDSHAEDLEKLRLGLEMLPPWHAEVVRRRFGLGGRLKQTADSIAREAGVSTCTIFKIQRLALGRLRKEMKAAIPA